MMFSMTTQCPVAFNIINSAVVGQIQHDSL